MLRAKLNEWNVLVSGLKSIGNLVGEANVIATSQGIEVITLDPANVAMVQFKMPASRFIEYKIDGDEFIFGLNLKEVNKILKKLTKDSTLIIDVDQKIELKIDVKGKFKEFSTGLLDLGDKKTNLPELKFNTIVSFPVIDFEDALSDSGIVADTCTLSVDTNRIFKVDAKGELSKSSTTLLGGVFIQFDKDKESKAKYSLEYLNNFLSKDFGKDVKIYLGKNYPIKMEYVNDSGSTLTYICAPRIEND